MVVLCPGCRKSFSFGSLSQHLARTSRPACRAIYEQQRAYIPGAEDSDSNHTSQPSDDEEDTQQTVAFVGDYFGDDYNDEDLPGWGNPGNEPSSSSSSSDDSNPSLSLSSSDESSSSDEEPELFLEAPAPPTKNAQLDPIPDPMDDEHGQTLTPEERRRAEEDVWAELVVCKFPGQAGAPIEEENKSGYTSYKDSLGKRSKNNPYAPFTSKTDWEMARWAKLRGPSSTAVTELMQIENVSLLTLLYYIYNDLRVVATRDPSTVLQECKGVE